MGLKLSLRIGTMCQNFVLKQFLLLYATIKPILKCLAITAYRATKRGADGHITPPTKRVGALEIDMVVSNVPWLQESTMLI